MIFMRTVGTGKVTTDLAVTSLCMAVNGIHDPQICPNIKQKAVNEIHSFMMTPMTHLTQVAVSEGLEA